MNRLPRHGDSVPTVAEDLHWLDVTLFGEFQMGKSTLFNCLLGSPEAAIGNGMTPTTSKARSGELPDGVRLWDIPGLNANAADDREAWAAAEKSNLVLAIVENRCISHNMRTALARLRGTACVLLMNCLTPELPADPNHPANRATAAGLEDQCMDLGWAPNPLGLPHAVSVNIGWRARKMSPSQHLKNPMQDQAADQSHGADGLDGLFEKLAGTGASGRNFRRSLRLSARLAVCETAYALWLDALGAMPATAQPYERIRS